MKIKSDYLLREVAGNYVIVGVGAKSIDFNGIININETGAFIWKQLENDTNAEAVANAIAEEYNVDADVALKDVTAFIEKLKGAELIEE